MCPRLSVEPMARELGTLIQARIDDPRLTWSKDRSDVRVNYHQALPPSVKQTRAGRRQRLHRALKSLLELGDWIELGCGHFTPRDHDATVHE